MLACLPKPPRLLFLLLKLVEVVIVSDRHLADLQCTRSATPSVGQWDLGTGRHWDLGGGCDPWSAHVGEPCTLALLLGVLEAAEDEGQEEDDRATGQHEAEHSTALLASRGPGEDQLKTVVELSWLPIHGCEAHRADGVRDCTVRGRTCACAH
jgi:hypothetical protein